MKFILQILETIGTENIKLNTKQIDELLDLLSKEEYLENEEKIQKALDKSKVERKHEEAQTSTSSDIYEETLNKLDNGKHILNAEKTPTFESIVSFLLIIVVFNFSYSA